MTFAPSRVGTDPVSLQPMCTEGAYLDFLGAAFQKPVRVRDNRGSRNINPAVKRSADQLTRVFLQVVGRESCADLVDASADSSSSSSRLERVPCGTRGRSLSAAVFVVCVLIWPNPADSRDTQDRFHFACQIRRSSGSRRNGSRHRLVEGQSTRRKGPALRGWLRIGHTCTRPLQRSGEACVTFHQGDNNELVDYLSLGSEMASTICSNNRISNCVLVCPPSNNLALFFPLLHPLICRMMPRRRTTYCPQRLVQTNRRHLGKLVILVPTRGASESSSGSLPPALRPSLPP